MKFIIDAQLPPLLAHALTQAGSEAIAVREINLRNESDPVIWKYALNHQAVIITKDEDFPDRCLLEKNHPIIIWLRIGNTSNRALLQWLLPLWPGILQRIEMGDRLIEVR